MIYCRLSKEDGDKAVSNSIESQIAYCKDFVSNQKDLKLVCEPLCDDGYTGLNMERPSFMKLNELVIKKQIDCIVCKDLSRFTRDYIGGGEYLERILPEKEIRFIAINNCDTLKDDPQRIAFLMPIVNLFNDNYSRDTSIRIRSSLNVRRKNGDYMGATCPFGYKKNPQNRYKLVPEEGSATIVQLIFKLFKEGMVVQQIAENLNQRGILTPLLHRRSHGENIQGVFQLKENPEWEYNTVKRILMNEAYVGVIVQGKTSSKNYKSKKQLPTPENERIRVENAHEPLILLDDFLNVQEMLSRSTRSSPKEGTFNLLSGFVYCADCGSTMIKKTQKPYAYFICSEHKKYKNCSTHSINCKMVEDKVLSAIHKQIELMVDLEEIFSNLDSNTSDAWVSHSYEEQIGKLESEIKRFQQFKLRLYHDLNDKIINLEEYNQFKEEYDETIAQKESAKDKLLQQSQDYQLVGTKNWGKLFQKVENIEELNKNLLMSMVEKVLIHEKHGIEVVFKCTDELTNAQDFITFRTQEDKIMTL